MKRAYLEWRGIWRLTGGFCPKCYSSPPAPNCTICKGTNDYSYRASSATRDEWRRLYLAELRQP